MRLPTAHKSPPNAAASAPQGPLNYNPVEEFFFHRLKAGRPICVPNSGMQVRATC